MRIPRSEIRSTEAPGHSRKLPQRTQKKHACETVVSGQGRDECSSKSIQREGNTYLLDLL
ncbi:unnamed protein product [Acanthoscelides obtectus]|uniref:Uncharacterized protein n=1 Tax=Acanthoscelides obtectus TaxID=200917 RepID=A0A9P0PCS8_ACAOB|nr:unnamed protein product [Acanthoscelides obtectus]CAK1646435.1 hypothetical protein AOBTE_LOCUS14632 [Acanthoscelides obtectus]